MNDENAQVENMPASKECTPCPPVVRLWLYALVVLNIAILAILAWQWLA